MKKSLTILSTASALALVLAACGSAPEETDPTNGGGETSAEAVDYKACLVSDAGGWDDKSFNQSAYEGLQDAVAEYGIEHNELESSTDSDHAPNVDNLVADGCNLIIGVGFLLAPAVAGGAEANTDVHFALIDARFSDSAGEPVEYDNARPLVFNTAEAAYLAGYAAAATSQTGTVATFGGLQIPSVTIFMDGFVDGVARYNEDNGGDVAVIGWDKASQSGSFTGTFDRQDEGVALANQQLGQGADVIMPVAGPVGLGAASAVQDAGNAWIVGVDTDWTESTEYGDVVLTSVMKGIGESVVQAVGDGVNGEFSKEAYVGTLENEGVGLAPLGEGAPADLQTKLDELKQEIIDGTTVVETENQP